jgi:predicted RNase H-like HicB family nuclease
MATPQIDLKAIVHQEPDGYWAEVPELPGCVTEGDTLDELYSNLQEAVLGWLEADAKRQMKHHILTEAEKSDPRRPLRVLEFA